MEWVVMSVIWGGLMLYFIIPFHKNSEAPISVSSLRPAVKVSLQRVTFHRKFLLAMVLLILTCIAIWYSYKDLAWYNEAHGVPQNFNAIEALPFYLAGVTLYAMLIYIVVVVKRAFFYMKKQV
ncbi:hypothetical protein [Sutcliffiella horikoshii]|uniref:Uncharacterized protein n=2 Tax=Sutcliffiella horikoshii TaxID=79883 RepID=A0A5D4T1R6_9BACI|nr:hypothetical protein FZC75_17380 [Sutcliffiella horikoshii]